MQSLPVPWPSETHSLEHTIICRYVGKWLGIFQLNAGFLNISFIVGFCFILFWQPERISGSSYDYKSDIWSFGLVILECAIGRFPYVPSEQEGWLSFYELLEAIVDQPPPAAPTDQFSPEFCSFISAWYAHLFRFQRSRCMLILSFLLSYQKFRFKYTVQCLSRSTSFVIPKLVCGT